MIRQPVPRSLEPLDRLGLSARFLERGVRRTRHEFWAGAGMMAGRLGVWRLSRPLAAAAEGAPRRRAARGV